MFANICICVLWLLQGLNMKNENWKMRIVIVIMWLQKSASLSLPLSSWIIPYNGSIFQLQKGGPTNVSARSRDSSPTYPVDLVLGLATPWASPPSNAVNLLDEGARLGDFVAAKLAEITPATPKSYGPGVTKIENRMCIDPLGLKLPV